MSIWDIMRISISGIHSHQTAMQVVSHNVANVNTPGYMRQSAELRPIPPRMQSGLFIGTGVDVSAIRRAEARFVNFNIFMGNMNLGYQNARSSGLSQIEEIFNESGEVSGLSGAMNEFWDAWSDLASTPEGSGERYALRGKAQILINQFHSANFQLTSLQKNANQEIKGLVGRVNQITTQIGDLNLSVARIEAGGQSAADYRTQRNNLMEELSTIIDYTYFEDDKGMMTINVAGGLPLVEQMTVSNLEVRNNPANNAYYDVYFVSQTGNEFNITSKIKGGEVYANLRIRDEYTNDLFSELDELAYGMIEEVNNIHVTAFGLNGNTGNNFFTPLAGPDGASNIISIDASIQADVENVAAALTNNPGDNQAANQLALLRDGLVMEGGTTTFQEFYGSVVSGVGNEAQSAEREYEYTEAIMNQLINYRESKTGVSLEEEMADLVMIQQAYQASARLINVASDMLEILATLR